MSSPQSRARGSARSGAPPVGRDKLPKDVVLLQLAMVLWSGGALTYAQLQREFLLERRTAERYLADLRSAGLPIRATRVSEGREATFALDARRARGFRVEAVDVPPAAARSLSLLLVAAALLPSSLGVREAVDSTVRAALRLRGLKAASELRRLEDAVMVLENDAKDYAGKSDLFGLLLDATLAGQALEVEYRSASEGGARVERFFPATIGLYRGGLYVLAVAPRSDGARPLWRALERIVGTPRPLPDLPSLSPAARLRALDEAKKRWGPARTRKRAGGGASADPPEAPGEEEQVITLHFSERVAPYVLARPWHARAEVEPWPAEEGGGVRMALRLSGETAMFESWVRSWGPEVQVLRPLALAERIAAFLAEAAEGHRRAALAFGRALDEEAPDEG